MIAFLHSSFIREDEELLERWRKLHKNKIKKTQDSADKYMEKQKEETAVLEMYWWFCFLRLLMYNRGSIIYHSRLIPLSESHSREEAGVLKQCHYFLF